MNAGQILVGLSGLSGVSAGAHLLAITAGTGMGTVFASRFTVVAEVPQSTLVRKAKRGAPSPTAQLVSPAQRPRKKSSADVLEQKNRVDVLAQADTLWVTSAAHRTAYVTTKPNALPINRKRTVSSI